MVECGQVGILVDGGLAGRAALVPAELKGGAPVPRLRPAECMTVYQVLPCIGAQPAGT